jgi:hypothetical protein
VTSRQGDDLLAQHSVAIQSWLMPKCIRAHRDHPKAAAGQMARR